jgi:hypothetical protein
MPARTVAVADGMLNLVVMAVASGECRGKNGPDAVGLDEECVMADECRYRDEMRRAAQTVGEVAHLHVRHHAVAFGGHERAWRGDRQRIDAVEVGRQGQREKAFRFLRLAAKRSPQLRRYPSTSNRASFCEVATGALLKRSANSAAERYVVIAMPRAIDSASVTLPVSSPSSTNAALQRAKRSSHSMRLVRGADDDQPLDLFAEQLGESQGDHAAIRRAHETHAVLRCPRREVPSQPLAPGRAW